MKKITILLCLLLCACFIFTACSNTAPSSEELANPMKSQKSVEEINSALSVKLSVPEKVDDIEYYIVGDDLGQVSWLWRGVDWVYRAQATTEDISGYYSEVVATQTVSVKAENGESTSVTVKELDDGCVAFWFWGDVQYNLSCNSNYAEDAKDLATKLAQESGK